MTKDSSINTSIDKTKSADKASSVQLFLYYFSFILIYAALYFIAVSYLMDYEQKYGTSNWVNDAKMTEKISFVISSMLQFPFALIVGLFINNDTIWLLTLLLNSLLFGWTLQKLIIKIQ